MLAFTNKGQCSHTTEKLRKAEIRGEGRQHGPFVVQSHSSGTG